MKDHTPIMHLAKTLKVSHQCIRGRMQREGVEPVRGPLITSTGVRVVQWVPNSYVQKLIALYSQAKANTHK